MSDSPNLLETLDYLVDFLRDETETLRQCCLISKAWIPCTRKRLFATVKFLTSDHIEKWKKAFPDPSKSPAHYTHTLRVKCTGAIATADAAEGGWILAFSHVVCLEVYDRIGPAFAPFHAFSHTVKSLTVVSIAFSLLDLWNLIVSLPLLENLTLFCGDGLIPNLETVNTATFPPALTGTLDLQMASERMSTGAVDLLVKKLPNGLHFRKFNLDWDRTSHFGCVMKLVEACSDTLEYLDLDYSPQYDESVITTRINLSKATKLKAIVFHFDHPEIEWIVGTLETMTDEHQDLEQISFDLTGIMRFDRLDKDKPVAEWLKLDSLVVQFWEKHSIRTKLICCRPLGKHRVDRGKSWTVCPLFPDAMKRGIVEVVEGPN